MLYLFDCDGVLIDSEIIAAEVDADLLTAAGYEITADEVTKRFAGMPLVKIHEIVGQEMGRPLPDDFIEKQRIETRKRMEEELDVVEGVEDMLDRLDGPKAVCSNSTGAYLEAHLGHTQLLTRFAPHVYSAVEVGTKESKPSPNVYRFAAEAFGVDPAEVVVLEDSPVGVQAAVAAGARVVGFTGGSHTFQGHADQLTEAGAETVINRHADFPETAKALVSWQKIAI